MSDSENKGWWARFKSGKKSSEEAMKQMEEMAIMIEEAQSKNQLLLQRCEATEKQHDDLFKKHQALENQLKKYQEKESEWSEWSDWANKKMAKKTKEVNELTLKHEQIQTNLDELKTNSSQNAEELHKKLSKAQSKFQELQKKLQVEEDAREQDKGKYQQHIVQLNQSLQESRERIGQLEEVLEKTSRKLVDIEALKKENQSHQQQAEQLQQKSIRQSKLLSEILHVEKRALYQGCGRGGFAMLKAAWEAKLPEFLDMTDGKPQMALEDLRQWFERILQEAALCEQLQFKEESDGISVEFSSIHAPGIGQTEEPLQGFLYSPFAALLSAVCNICLGKQLYPVARSFPNEHTEKLSFRYEQ